VRGTISFVLVFVLVIVCLFGGYAYLNNKANYKHDKAGWLKEKARLQDSVNGYAKAAEHERRNAEEAEARANKWKEEAENVVIELEQERADFARKLEEIATMAPDQLVIAHHFHLSMDSTQVWLNSFGLQFTLEASRKNLELLDERSFFLKVEIPKLNVLLSKRDGENRELRLSIDSHKNTARQLYLEIDDLGEQVRGETALRLKAEKLSKFQLFSTETLVGGVVGLALGLILGIF
jgi:hypothetical protein